MRISIARLALLMMMLVMAACTPSLMSPAAPGGVSGPAPAYLPDLIIKLIYLEMEGRRGNCVGTYTPYGMRVLVENIGSAGAGPFVVDLNGARQQVDGGLTAGQFIELHFTGTAPGGRYEAHADATNQVVEYREDNNSLSFLAPTPTPPPLCTATPIATQ
jgi:subtilase family serine protease